MTRRIPAVLALAFFASLVSAEDSLPYAPARVHAENVAPALALVTWVPGDEPADSFRVYGMAEEGLVLLADTASTATPFTLASAVPGDHSAYAVSGVRGGAESPLVFASSRPCSIYVETTPHPRVSLANCIDGGDILRWRAPPEGP